VLVVLILVVLATPYIYKLFHAEKTVDFKDFDKAVALLSKTGNQSYPANGKALSDEKIPHPVMFPFDPNKLSIEQWKQLGLSERQATIIQHYTAKGGKFYKPEDLKKIYSATPVDYKRLLPYVNIAETVYIHKKLKRGEIIELNSADSAKLTELKGIGPAFAMKIVRYRGRLGGFFHKEQLKQIVGIDSLKYTDLSSQVSTDPSKVKKIDINTVSFNQLRLFPYLSYNQVNAIIQYRTQHGKYNSPADIKNIVLLDDRTLHLIQPYLNFK
jgi:competence protein ComEA